MNNWQTQNWPPSAGKYLVTLLRQTNRGKEYTLAIAYWPGRRSKRWETVTGFASEIVAWMPLPLPSQENAHFGFAEPNDQDWLSKLATEQFKQTE